MILELSSIFVSLLTGTIIMALIYVMLSDDED